MSAMMEYRLDGATRWACRSCITEFGETLDNCGPWGPDPVNDPTGHLRRVEAGEREHNLKWHTPAVFAWFDDHIKE